MTSKTIALSGAETRVDYSGGTNAWLRNDGAGTVYASAAPGVTAGADGVVSIPAGQAAAVYDAYGTVYLLGTGSVQLVGSDYTACPFKSTVTLGSVTEEISGAVSNPNLLINPDFKINQRGETAWSIGTTHTYFVDRWYSARSELSLSDDGLMFAWNGKDDKNGWIQHIVNSPSYFGKTVTISLNANDTIYNVTSEIPTAVDTTTFKSVEGASLAVGVTNHAGKYFSVVLFSLSIEPVIIKWLKCELGNIATPFIPPNPTEELLKIQSMNDYGTPKLISNNTLPTIMNSQMVSNPNLLINPDFKINQYGITSVAGGDDRVYFADRWHSEGCSVTNTGGVISAAWDGSYIYDDGTNTGFIQSVLELPELIGKQVTLSVNIDGVRHHAVFTIPTTFPGIVRKAVSEDIDIAVGNYANIGIAAILFFKSTTSHIIGDVKLETGGIATPFIPPDPAAELLKCQRYYWDSGKGVYGAPGAYSVSTADMVSLGDGTKAGYCNVKFPAEMRIKPTVTIVSYDGTKNAVSKWVDGATIDGTVIVGSANLSSAGFTDVRLPDTITDIIGFHIVADAEF